MASHSERADSIKAKAIEEVAPDDWLRLLVRRTLEMSSLQDGVVKKDEEKWKVVQREIIARNLFLFHELHRILEIFNRKVIRVIVLKGAALTEGVYPHLWLRFFGDIDLLIRREKLPQVAEILSGLGYRRYVPQLCFGADEFQGAVNYVKEGEPPIMIDAHWTLGPQYPYSSRVDMDGVWERARKAKIAGTDTLVLCPEDFLLHLCLHLFQHWQKVSLTSSSDIAQLTYRCGDELDWQIFLSRVFKFKVSLPVKYALQKTFDLFKPPIPPFVLEQLDTYKPSRFERRIFTSHASSRGKDSEGTVILARLLTMPGITLKLRYIWTLLVPSRDFMIWRYAITNPKLLPFYYLLRVKNSFLMTLKAVVHFTFARKGG